MIRKVVESTSIEAGWTEVTFSDGSTLAGESVEIVAKLRKGHEVELVPGEVYGRTVRMMTFRIKT